MKILSASTIREWDQFTIMHEPISSIDLMERAARQCVQWILNHFATGISCKIFCGKGNNGGDGLAIARMLAEKKYSVNVYVLEFGKLGSPDFQTNLHRLHHYPQVAIHYLQDESHFPAIKKNELVIDAIFGSGLNQPLANLALALVNHINQSLATIISIDMPSGLFADQSSKDFTTIQATATLSFQAYKTAFLFAENANAFGHIQVLDIGLSAEFPALKTNTNCFIDKEIISAIYKPRKPFTHKGSFGHALIFCGSYGKMGAAILCAKACLRSGVGLLTIHVPISGYEIIQTTVPEAMVSVDSNSTCVTEIVENLSSFTCFGLGPGIGLADETANAIAKMMATIKQPLVIDADALNLISKNPHFLKSLPEGSILTPHPKEFARLFGETKNEFDQMQLAQQKAAEHQCIIVLKGHHTLIATPTGKCYFNNTGNAGMATAGSGDVLTGIITGLLAQLYAPEEAAVLGVYLHGLAGDLAADKISQEALLASDIIENLGAAFLQMVNGNLPI